MMSCCGGIGWLGMLSMLVGTLVVLALLALLVWALIRWLPGRMSRASEPFESTPSGESSALEILEQRYARGEIDQATFERMREQLQASQRTNSSSGSSP